MNAAQARNIVAKQLLAEMVAGGVPSLRDAHRAIPEHDWRLIVDEIHRLVSCPMGFDEAYAYLTWVDDSEDVR
jgi:hypothetical protein